MKLLSVPEVSQFSCEGCVKFSETKNCECDCKPGQIFKMDTKEFLSDEDYDPELDGYPTCRYCKGSGEGFYQGTTCSYCKGSGVEKS